jgi:hypothetical protein
VEPRIAIPSKISQVSRVRKEDEETVAAEFAATQSQVVTPAERFKTEHTDSPGVGHVATRPPWPPDGWAGAVSTTPREHGPSSSSAGFSTIPPSFEAPSNRGHAIGVATFELVETKDSANFNIEGHLWDQRSRNHRLTLPQQYADARTFQTNTNHVFGDTEHSGSVQLALENRLPPPTCNGKVENFKPNQTCSFQFSPKSSGTQRQTL